MRVLAILLRVCTLAVVATLALPLVSASAYAHGGHNHGMMVFLQIKAPAACSANAGATPCSPVVHASEIAVTGEAPECEDGGCCAPQFHVCPVLAIVESTPAYGARRQVVPIVWSEHSEGVAPARPPEPPNYVLS